MTLTSHIRRLLPALASGPRTLGVRAFATAGKDGKGSGSSSSRSPVSESEDEGEKRRKDVMLDKIFGELTKGRHRLSRLKKNFPQKIFG